MATSAIALTPKISCNPSRVYRRHRKLGLWALRLRWIKLLRQRLNSIPPVWDKRWTEGQRMAKHRIYTMSFAKVYPLLVAKAEKKGRSKAEVDEVVRWLTGYSQQALEDQIAKQISYEEFFAQTPRMNPSRTMITGLVCGVRVEDIEERTMREIRYMDKLIDELAKGKAMSEILRA